MNTYPNTLTNEFIGSITIDAWKGYTVRADIEEPVESITDFIIYKNHGDELALVHTQDNWYEYGCYFNFDKDRIRSFDDFVRKPVAFVEYDERGKVSNDLYWEMTKIRTHIKWDRFDKKYVSDVSSSYAQMIFDRIVGAFAKAYDSNVYYNHEQDKREIETFLSASGINTPDNLAALDSMHFNSKRDGLDGICGKDYAEDIGVEQVLVWYHNGVNMETTLDVDDEYYSGASLDDEDLDGDEWGSYTWWVTPDNLVHKLALMKDIPAPDLTIAARYSVVMSLRSKLEAIEKELTEAEDKLQAEIRKAHEIDPEHDYEIFGDKIVCVERKEN